ncbi:hypothetical protein FDF74_05705 [Clostridium niameyense]|uniref:Uncharacterized protein n=1 Tax=Clostridium niameyense TaxID=1622073 RepID=A0A6M0RAM0_9CLOT|nr:DUF6514 family protein [Clostridium niameyense]NEZ46710.1 hypothetical protein [Clostridium niameyense]
MKGEIEVLVKKQHFDNKEYVYYYKLLKNDIYLSYEYDNIKLQSYGIEIERQDFKGKNMINIEKDKIKNISPYRYKVHNLLKMLYENSVSPIHLIDIVSNYVDEYVFDYDYVSKNVSHI